MPRREPINPHGYYHVSTRGNFGQPMFQSRAEHALRLDLYARFAPKFGIKALGWTLLWNHDHLLVKLTDGGLSEFMRRVNHTFSRRLNAVYGRTGSGHMVRHCFFASEISDDDHLRTVCRYIDLNPVEAKLCRHPEEWLWSGYGATVGLVRAQPFHDVATQLSFFGRRPQDARQGYEAFVAQDRSRGTVTKASRSGRAA